MRMFPSFMGPSFRARRRRKRAAGPRVPTARSVLLIEVFAALAVLVVLLTGRRGAFFDTLHPRADALLVLLMAGLVGVIHFYMVTRVLPEMRRRHSPAVYDQQRILLDLNDAARHSNNLTDVYGFSVETIARALETADVAILVSDQETGNLLLRSSSNPALATANGSADALGVPTPEGAHSNMALARDAFVVRRLSKLTQPMRIDTGELDLWQRASGFISGIDNPKRELERQTLLKLNTRLLVQIRNKGGLTGILSVGPRRSGFDFTDSDLKTLMAIAEQLALVIDNSHLLERIVDQEKTLHEMALAASVQKHLFPVEVPESAKMQISGCCKPAGFVGGDYYDFMQFQNGQISFAVADVAGKGFSAALLTFMIHAFLRSQTLTADADRSFSLSLPRMAESLNRLLFASTSSASYVTLFYAFFDENSGRLSFINAGHNPPFVLHSGTTDIAPAFPARQGTLPSLSSNGAVMKLGAGGPMLGLFQDCPVTEQSFQLNPGDFLFAYTDGATEAVNRSGEELGEDRLLRLVKSKSHLHASAARDEIMHSIEEWCQGAPQADDITMVVLKVNAA
ncbi:MAG TPA: SpoIIE family protein phosphatase [Candidatus Angelobacter sp.]|nr:SpoIIE family protein phosphatase [Candidatus Angelobacter sp.]